MEQFSDALISGSYDVATKKKKQFWGKMSHKALFKKSIQKPEKKKNHT